MTQMKTYFKAYAGERVDVTISGDDGWHSIVLDERHNEFRRHPARRAGKERCDHVPMDVPRRIRLHIDFFNDLRKPEVGDDRFARVVNQNVSLDVDEPMSKAMFKGCYTELELNQPLSGPHGQWQALRCGDMRCRKPLGLAGE
jgi:hypothetical protein